MKSAAAALVAALTLLTGCVGIKSGGEGVFTPTAVELPPSARGPGSDATAAAPDTTPAAERRGLAVPAR